MNPDHPSHDASMSLQYGYMALSNTTFDARVGCVGTGTLMDVSDPKEPARARCSMPLTGCSPFTRG